MPVRPSAIEVVQQFIELVARGADGVEELTTPDLIVVTHPNLFAPAGHTRTRSESAAAREVGKRTAPDQRWRIQRIEETAPGCVVVRATWDAVLAVDVGPYPTGTGLQAELAQFFEVRDGRIARLETFDCYHPPRMP